MKKRKALMLATLLTIGVGYWVVIGQTFKMNEELKEARLERKKSDPNYQAKGFIGIGEELKLEYIQHIEGDEYNIGFKENDQLKWEKVGGFSHHLTTLLDEEETTAYIVRENDKERGYMLVANYTLHIPENFKIDGGTVEKLRSGRGNRSEYEDIKTEMIYY
ncbi:hypothetical protein QTG56_24595 (plasmid) [Rossellomorea sp. AcN35-11]|nr:hypothetical protein [Rossellomorea aquimaris]WJV31815.1 hypothetical protein QTG56_24595 [Rossellomorea sp. AcN35-11]